MSGFQQKIRGIQRKKSIAVSQEKRNEHTVPEEAQTLYSGRQKP